MGNVNRIAFQWGGKFNSLERAHRLPPASSPARRAVAAFAVKSYLLNFQAHTLILQPQPGRRLGLGEKHLSYANVDFETLNVDFEMLSTP